MQEKVRIYLGLFGKDTKDIGRLAYYEMCVCVWQWSRRHHRKLWERVQLGHTQSSMRMTGQQKTSERIDKTSHAYN